MTSSPLEQFTVVGSVFSNISLLFACAFFFTCLCGVYTFSSLPLDPISPLFLFVLGLNTVSMVTYTINPFTQFILSIAFSFAIILGHTIYTAGKHSITTFSQFIPSGVPLSLAPLVLLIEVISYSARVISLSIRILMQYRLRAYFNGCYLYDFSLLGIFTLDFFIFCFRVIRSLNPVFRVLHFS